MKAHLQYLSYVLRHKWFVLVECWKMGIFWRGLVHDLSKFTPAEWFPYVRYFYGDGGTRESKGDYNVDDTPQDFEMAWNHHQKANDHHWQYWVRFGDDGTVKVLPMPPKARAEMLCDWRGAGRALGKPDTLAWYSANLSKMILYPETRAWIEWKLGYYPPCHPELMEELGNKARLRMSLGASGNPNAFDYP